MANVIDRIRCTKCESCGRANVKVHLSPCGHIVRCEHCRNEVHETGKRTDAIATWNQVQHAIATARLQHKHGIVREVH